jgi:ABC-type oligopeptide transport system substrate-binding subunit
MDVVIREVDAEVHKQSLEAGSFDLALCTFYLNVNPDISNIVATGGLRNYGGFSDAELDALLESCKAASDEQAMKEAYLAMEDRFLTMMPHIGLYFRTNALLYNASLNVSDGLRDRNLFSTMPSWYMFVKEAGE